LEFFDPLVADGNLLHHSKTDDHIRKMPRNFVNSKKF